jgi:osmoprotectant transport system permease protein
MAAHPFVTFVSERLSELLLRTSEHLMLTGCSTLAAVLIGVPLGIVLIRATWLRSAVVGAIGIVQTIPSLAMLVFLLALLQKIGVIPALIALTLYALLPIVRNTVAGIQGVSAEVIEAARGIGMTEYQQLAMIRIPLARPVILTGIRTAAVIGVGIATLSAFIGAGGLGQFINRGLALSDTKLILLGAIPAALLALVMDFSIGASEWALRPATVRNSKTVIRRVFRYGALLMPLCLILGGILSYLTGPSMGLRASGFSRQPLGTIRIGTKNFTEQLILGELLAQLIENKTNLRVERRFNLGGTMICHEALINGEIDLYPEYTGTALTAILKHPIISDPEQAFTYVNNVYRERYGAIWLRPFGFNNTYTITVREADAERYSWVSISDLRTRSPHLRAGFTSEFVERPDGYVGLKQVYRLEFGEVRDMDPALMYQAVAKGEVDVICAFATDGRIASYDLKTLRDDRRFFPPYQAASVINELILDAYPEVAGALSSLGGLLDDLLMQHLNFKVDAKKQSPAEVARAFLLARDLI